MFSGQRCVWSVYKIAGEAYGSKLVGHYCSPRVAYMTALSKQLDKHNEEVKAFLQGKCVREELYKLQHEAVSCKDFLNKTIYHVKATEYSEGVGVTKCSSCKSLPPHCLH